MEAELAGVVGALVIHKLLTTPANCSGQRDPTDMLRQQSCRNISVGGCPKIKNYEGLVESQWEVAVVNIQPQDDDGQKETYDVKKTIAFATSLLNL